MLRLFLLIILAATAGCKRQEDSNGKGESQPESKPSGTQKQVVDDVSSNEIDPPITEPEEEGGTLFFSARRGSVGLFRMGVDGSGVKNLRMGGSPAASSDGKRIAFVQFYNDTNRFEIAVMSADGDNVTRLTTDKYKDSANPCWSRDGSRIAYQTGPKNTPDIAVMKPDGSGGKVLTMHAAADSEPSWSPDGKRIAFTSMRDGNAGIFVINTDASGVKRLTPKSERCHSPAWSPDGRYIAFIVTYRNDGWKRDIRVMTPKGKWWTVAKNLDNAGSLCWSPKGGWLTYWATVKKAQDIYVTDLTGKRTRKLTNGEGFHTSVTWAK